MERETGEYIIIGVDLNSHLSKYTQPPSEIQGE